MRRLLLLAFAALDAAILLRVGVESLRQPIRCFAERSGGSAIVYPIEALRVILVLCLAAGVWKSLRGSRGIGRLTLIQLPLRLFFGVIGEPLYLSFVFLRPAVLSSSLGPVNPYAVLGALGMLEIVRALLTSWPGQRSRSRPLPIPATPGSPAP